jgi:tetratricopeptide (TPR) repeat protein
MRRLYPKHHRLNGLLISIGAALLLTLVAACQPEVRVADAPLPTFDRRYETDTPVPTETFTPAPPTPDNRTLDQLCFDLDKFWNSDWVEVITVLEKVRKEDATCGDKDPTQMLYPAYYNYGVLLERRGSRDAAIDAYQRAHELNPAGGEAADALKRFNAFTPEPLAACTPERVESALLALPVYTPAGKGDFVRLQDGKFVVGGLPFRVRGVNYYPVRAPWRRFLGETDLAVAAKELDLIAGARLNTLRIFLWYDAMFECPASGLVPIKGAFERLDGIIRLAAQHNMRLIITLHDLPDLTVRPLYTHPETSVAQTMFIVTRYKDEPAILAWDLRNEGDIDYTRYKQAPSAVLSWLRETSAQVRSIDHNHLITAGWLSNPLVTDAAVDFFSFHHWTDGNAIAGRVADIRAVSQKPILLEEVGYNTWSGDVDGQTAKLRSAIGAADRAGMLGWVVWTAFDFPTDATCWPPACPSKDNGEHHFGLWRTDYRPKPAVDMLRNYDSP